MPNYLGNPTGRSTGLMGPEVQQAGGAFQQLRGTLPSLGSVSGGNPNMGAEVAAQALGTPVLPEGLAPAGVPVGTDPVAQALLAASNGGSDPSGLMNALAALGAPGVPGGAGISGSEGDPLQIAAAGIAEALRQPGVMEELFRQNPDLMLKAMASLAKRSGGVMNGG